VAIGLVILAGVLALPIAIGAWLIGAVSFVEALAMYVLIGWAVMAAGFFSALFGHVADDPSVENTVKRQAIPMKVKSGYRG
jgi:uncharacterized membrane protein